ncbi:penicillin-binding transpeptidase domain-containing protein [Brevibacillus ruminantium]|uniref:Penicillin-binding transpeptidase domain-containing protein n=1 Tax=Brevibacillus ruminantium TaxID=2950604 RepID=A0ABY4WE32_9BACL|nr:penicillin-binding transpeptidase domain-containing protein [Brevibacillus ruminantium]USG64388.1 penicillin-binding transpeptidase domain-containing protein [Brevibacillus ruminantium]
MTPSSEDKEIRTLLDSFPRFRMDEHKQREIAEHIYHVKESLARMKRRKQHRKWIGGIVISFAFVLIVYQLVIPLLSSSVPIAQRMIEEEVLRATSIETHEKKAETVLTIDPQIQAYVDEALQKANALYHPENMTVIVSDPNTGEILAIGNHNPEAIDDKKQADAVRAMPSPVAAFPVVTLAAAIQEGKFNPTEIYESGTYEIAPGELIKDHNNGIGWGKIPYLEGIQRSSNVAFAKLGSERLQGDVLQEYLERFGFGQKTAIELTDEEAGQIPNLGNAREVAVAAMGQAGSASAIQQVAAIGAIANGGKLLRPHINKKPESKKNHEYYVRQVISEETARKVRDILESVVHSQFGADKTFVINNYPVAGKSGISPKYDQQGKVMDNKQIFSFIGFAPSNNPKLLVYVAVDGPKIEPPVGLAWRKVVSPLFREVMENSLQHLQQQKPVD